MNSIPNIERLLKLADHLEYGTLGHEKFDFTVMNDGPFLKKFSRNARLETCGTAGCAIGECPFVFEEWYFDNSGSPVIENHHESNASARDFFNLTKGEVSHLFYDGLQIPHFGGELLQPYATKEEVAQNIRAFCEIFKNRL